MLSRLSAFAFTYHDTDGTSGTSVAYATFEIACKPAPRDAALPPIQHPAIGDPLTAASATRA
jgi:hypothetical protein